MHIVLGATGHVGSAVAGALLEAGERVTIITRDPSKAEALRGKGAEVEVADIAEPQSLREIFRRGRRLFLLNPPAAPSGDTDAEERKSVSSLVSALESSGLEKIVAESTYGARPGDRIGDLAILYELEEALKAQPIPARIIRAAYYMSNWDSALSTARDKGVVQTFFPADFALPMVAPDDIGRFAAELLMQPADQTGTAYVEGPRRYTSADVAAAFANALGKPVKCVTVPREDWEKTFKSLGFSDAAARSYAGMTAVTLDGDFHPASQAHLGKTSLGDYIKGLAAADVAVTPSM